jgi:SAM-dependent methyltransferase
MAIADTPTGGWSDADQVEWYLRRIGRLDARLAGEQVLASVLPPAPTTVLDLGCGDGRLIDLVRAVRPSVRAAVGVDRSDPMLDAARARFGRDDAVELRRWDLDDPIEPLGRFDLVVSGFAIHHLEHDRKRALFGEVARQLDRGGMFANLEVVASSTARWHAQFLAEIGRTADDLEDRLAPVEDQLEWMRAGGLTEVECVWRWRGFALLVGLA